MSYSPIHSNPVSLSKRNAMDFPSGADCSRVMVIDDNDQALTMMDARLEEAIIQTKAHLVVLDPIQGFLGTYAQGK